MRTILLTILIASAAAALFPVKDEPEEKRPQGMNTKIYLYIAVCAGVSFLIRELPPGAHHRAPPHPLRARFSAPSLTWGWRGDLPFLHPTPPPTAGGVALVVRKRPAAAGRRQPAPRPPSAAGRRCGSGISPGLKTQNRPCRKRRTRIRTTTKYRSEQRKAFREWSGA